MITGCLKTMIRGWRCLTRVPCPSGWQTCVTACNSTVSLPPSLPAGGNDIPSVTGMGGLMQSVHTARGSNMNDMPTYRPASAGDSRFIAEMIDISSDGVALLEWTNAALETGHLTALDIGAGMYASQEGDYSYRNCCLAEVSGRRAGMLLGFPLHARDPADAASPPPFDGSDVFAPYKYLEAPGTWYVCGVAVLPDYRGRGIGKKLMQIAGQQARDHGYDRLSLVVFEQNGPAVSLYERLGYELAERAPIVPHPLIRASGDALLMVAPAY